MALILGITGSPRKGGNSEVLLEVFLKETVEATVKVEVFSVRDLKISPCLGCRFCEEKGFCKLSDQMGEIYALFKQADLVVISTPVFFYGFPAQLKALVDRSQALWSRRYKLGLRDPKSPWRKGVVLAVGATKGERLFLGIELSSKYFFDAIGAHFEGVIGAKGFDRPREVLGDEDFMYRLRQRAKELLFPLTRRKKVLFVCKHNACRSQMAQAFLEFYGGDRFEALSAGDDPWKEIHPMTFQLMAEKGLDLYFRKPKHIEDILEDAPFDLVVSMGCEVSCPMVPGKRFVQWDLEDPIGKPIEVGREVRDLIEKKVKELLEGV